MLDFGVGIWKLLVLCREFTPEITHHLIKCVFLTVGCSLLALIDILLSKYL